MGNATLAARRLTLEARRKEAADDKDGIGTEGAVLPGEVYSAQREWVSEEFQEAYAEQKGQAKNPTKRTNDEKKTRYSSIAYLSFAAACEALVL